MTPQLMNLVNHRRLKPGVSVELFINTVIPLDAELYRRIVNVIAGLDELFDAIPGSQVVTS